jgi:hypothetical protein
MEGNPRLGDGRLAEMLEELADGDDEPPPRLPASIFHQRRAVDSQDMR